MLRGILNFWQNNSSDSSVDLMENREQDVHAVTIQENFQEAEEASEIQSFNHPQPLSIKNKIGRTALHKAVVHNNISLVKELADKHLEIIDSADDEGNTSLHLSASGIKVTSEISNILLTAGASVNAQNTVLETPLHRAVAARRLDNIRLFLLQGANVELKTNNGNTPLHNAFLKDLNFDIVSALLEAKANLNEPNEAHQTPFYFAIRFHHKRLVELGEKGKQLINMGDVTLQPTDREKKTVLHEVTQKNVSIELFSMILEKCVQAKNGSIDVINYVDANGNTALVCAVMDRDTEKTRLLLRQNPNPNLYGKNCNPLHQAVRNNDIDLVVALHRVGAELNAVDTKGNTPLHIAAQDNKDVMIKKLVELGAGVMVENNQGNMPLVYAAEHGNVEAIRCLCPEFFFTARLGNAQGEKAIKKALLNNHVEALIELIKLGANPNVHVKLYHPSEDNNLGSSSLSFGSVSSSRFPSASIQLSQQDDADKTGCLKSGDTPLHYAVKVNHRDLAEECLKACPELVNAANDKGITPADLVIKMVSPEMAHLLWEKGAKIEDLSSYPGIAKKASSYFRGESRGRTKLMVGAARSFDSEQLGRFFREENYQLTDEQKEIRDEKAKKYQPKVKAEKTEITSMAMSYHQQRLLDSAVGAIRSQQVDANNNEIQSAVEIRSFST